MKLQRGGGDRWDGCKDEMISGRGWLAGPLLLFLSTIRSCAVLCCAVLCCAVLRRADPDTYKTPRPGPKQAWGRGARVGREVTLRICRNWSADPEIGSGSGNYTILCVCCKNKTPNLVRTHARTHAPRAEGKSFRSRVSSEPNSRTSIPPHVPSSRPGSGTPVHSARGQRFSSTSSCCHHMLRNPP